MEENNIIAPEVVAGGDGNPKQERIQSALEVLKNYNPYRYKSWDENVLSKYVEQSPKNAEAILLQLINSDEYEELPTSAEELQKAFAGQPFAKRSLTQQKAALDAELNRQKEAQAGPVSHNWEMGTVEPDRPTGVLMADKGPTLPETLQKLVTETPKDKQAVAEKFYTDQENDKKSWLQRTVETGKGLWTAAKTQGKSAAAFMTTILNPIPNPSGREETQRVIDKAQKNAFLKTAQMGEKEFQNKMKEFGVSTDIVDAVKSGRGSDIVQAVAFNAGQMGYQIPLSLGTLGISSFAMEGAEAYKGIVDAQAKALGITPEEVIAQGLDKHALGVAVGTVSGMVDFLGAKQLSAFLRAGGMYEQLSRAIIKQAAKSWGKKIAIRTAVAGGGEGTQEAIQEGIKIGGEYIASGKMPEQALDRVGRSFANAFVGGAGVYAGGRGAIRMAGLPSDLAQNAEPDLSGIGSEFGGTTPPQNPPPGNTPGGAPTPTAGAPGGQTTEDPISKDEWDDFTINRNVSEERFWGMVDDAVEGKDPAEFGEKYQTIFNMFREQILEKAQEIKDAEAQTMADTEAPATNDVGGTVEELPEQLVANESGVPVVEGEGIQSNVVEEEPQGVVVEEPTPQEPAEVLPQKPIVKESEGSLTKELGPSEKKSLHNRLVGLVKDFNNLPGNKKRSEGTEIQRQIRNLASTLNYTIGQDGNNLIVKDEKGKNVRRLGTKSDPLIEATDNEIAIGKKLVNAYIFDWDGDIYTPRLKTQLDWATIRKGVEDIRAEKTTTEAAKALIKEAGRIYAEGGIQMVWGRGAAIQNANSFPLSEILKIQDEFENLEEKPITNDELDEAEIWWNSLSEEEKNELIEGKYKAFENEYESEQTTETGANTGGKGDDAQKKEVPGEKPSPEEKEPIGKPIDRKLVEEQLSAANEELRISKEAFDQKRKELDKTVFDDQEDLFGNRKVEETPLFETPRVDPKQRDIILQPLKTRFEKAKAEVSRLNKLLETGKEIKVEIQEESLKQAVKNAGNQAATSPNNNLPEPTDAQKDVGNYKMGHVNVQGLEITIENPKGSERKGVDKSGNEWSVKMQHDYGYIKGTEGKDGDHVDVFIGPNPDGQKVFVVDQVDSNGRFDEHKALIGFASEDAARNGYLANYSKGWKGLGAITEMSLPEFKEWLKNEDTTKPVGGIKKKEAGGDIVKEQKSDNNPITVRNYRDAFDKIAQGANLTREEILDYLPAFMAENGMPMKAGPKDVQYFFNLLFQSDPADLLGDLKTNQGAMTKKIADWIESVKKEQKTNAQKNEAEAESKPDPRSSETLINEGRTIIGETKTTRPGEEAGAISRIEAHIDAIDAKIAKLTENWPTEDIDHEMPNVEVAKSAKADVKKYAYRVAVATGWPITADKKGKLEINANIAPAGGDVSFRLQMGNTPLEMYVSIKYNPDYNNGYENYKVEEIFYRVEDRSAKGQNKYLGSNQWVGGFGARLSKGETGIPNSKELAEILIKEGQPYINRYEGKPQSELDKIKEVADASDGKIIVGKVEPVETEKKKYDWDSMFQDGSKFSDKEIDVISVYDDDSVVSLEFTDQGFGNARQKETMGLLGITKNPVKLHFFWNESDVAKNQKLIRRIAAIAKGGGRVIVNNPLKDRANKRFPYLMVTNEDAPNYELAEEFQGELETPNQVQKKHFQQIFKKQAEKHSQDGFFLKQIQEGQRTAENVIEEDYSKAVAEYETAKSVRTVVVDEQARTKIIELTKQLNDLKESLRASEEAANGVRQPETEEDMGEGWGELDEDVLSKYVVDSIFKDIGKEEGYSEYEAERDQSKMFDKALAEDLRAYLSRGIEGISRFSQKAQTYLINVARKVNAKVLALLVTLGAGLNFSKDVMSESVSLPATLSVSGMQQMVSRGMVKMGLMDIDEAEGKIDTKAIMTNPQGNVVVAEKTKNSPKIEFTIRGSVKDSRDPSGKSKLWMYKRDAPNGALNYVAGPSVANMPSYGQKGVSSVEGVGHFMISEGDLTTLTKDSTLERLKGKILDEIKKLNPDNYIPAFRRISNDTVGLTFKKLDEITDDDVVMTQLVQIGADEINWDSKSSAPGFKASVFALTDKSGKPISSLLFAPKKDNYNRFSGGAFFILAETTEGLMVREMSGSIAMLEMDVNDMKNKYKIPLSNIKIGVMDAGSFSAKPAARGGMVNFSDYTGYNPNSEVGSSLNIPISGSISDKLINKIDQAINDIDRGTFSSILPFVPQLVRGGLVVFRESIKASKKLGPLTAKAIRAAKQKAIEWIKAQNKEQKSIDEAVKQFDLLTTPLDPKKMAKEAKEQMAQSRSELLSTIDTAMEDAMLRATTEDAINAGRIQVRRVLKAALETGKAKLTPAQIGSILSKIPKTNSLKALTNFIIHALSVIHNNQMIEDLNQMKAIAIKTIKANFVTSQDKQDLIPLLKKLNVETLSQEAINEFAQYMKELVGTRLGVEERIIGRKELSQWLVDQIDAAAKLKAEIRRELLEKRLERAIEKGEVPEDTTLEEFEEYVGARMSAANASRSKKIKDKNEQTRLDILELLPNTIRMAKAVFNSNQWGNSPLVGQMLAMIAKIDLNQFETSKLRHLNNILSDYIDTGDFEYLGRYASDRDAQLRKDELEPLSGDFRTVMGNLAKKNFSNLAGSITRSREAADKFRAVLFQKEQVEYGKALRITQDAIKQIEDYALENNLNERQLRTVEIYNILRQSYTQGATWQEWKDRMIRQYGRYIEIKEKELQDSRFLGIVVDAAIKEQIREAQETIDVLNTEFSGESIDESLSKSQKGLHDLIRNLYRSQESVFKETSLAYYGIELPGNNNHYVPLSPIYRFPNQGESKAGDIDDEDVSLDLTTPSFDLHQIDKTEAGTSIERVPFLRSDVIYGTDPIANFSKRFYQTVYQNQVTHELFVMSNLLNSNRFFEILSIKGSTKNKDAIRAMMEGVISSQRISGYMAIDRRSLFKRMVGGSLASVIVSLWQPLKQGIGASQIYAKVPRSVANAALKYAFSPGNNVDKFLENTSLFMRTSFQSESDIKKRHRRINEFGGKTIVRKLINKTADASTDVRDFMAKHTIEPADRFVTRAGLIAGYMNSLVEQGLVSDINSIDWAKEAENPNMQALASAETLADEINVPSDQTTKAEVLKTQKGDSRLLSMRDINWMLSSFDLNAYQDLVNNIRTITDSNANAEDKKQAAASAISQVANSLLYQATALVQHTTEGLLLQLVFEHFFAGDFEPLDKEDFWRMFKAQILIRAIVGPLGLAMGGLGNVLKTVPKGAATGLFGFIKDDETTPDNAGGITDPKTQLYYNPKEIPAVEMAMRLGEAAGKSLAGEDVDKIRFAASLATFFVGLADIERLTNKIIRENEKSEKRRTSKIREVKYIEENPAIRKNKADKMLEYVVAGKTRDAKRLLAEVQGMDEEESVNYLLDIVAQDKVRSKFGLLGDPAAYLNLANSHVTDEYLTVHDPEDGDVFVPYSDLLREGKIKEGYLNTIKEAYEQQAKDQEKMIEFISDQFPKYRQGIESYFGEGGEEEPLAKRSKRGYINLNE